MSVRLLLLLSTICLSSSLCAQTTVEREFHSNGELALKCEMRKGEKHGQCITYYPNGNIETEGNYLKGKAQGIHKVYFENGFVS